jgi:hypothetical protein|tara:strand:- start:1560 stop:2285 length:726 start_codon:yes stop_codon:yes gene_type:complete
MGFFKSIKKKLSIFKKQVQDILPNEIKDNPAVTAALIIGGSIPFGQSQQSLFAKGASGIGDMFSDPKGYFTGLNDTLGMGKSSAIKSKDLFTTSTGMIIKSKPSVPEYTGFLGKTIQGTRNLLDSSPTGKKIASNYMEKYLKDELSTGAKLQQMNQQQTASSTRNTSYRTGTNRNVSFKPSASSAVRPGYRNRYVQSSIYNILSNPNYKAIWSGGINSGSAISTSFTQASGPTTKLESSKI